MAEGGSLNASVNVDAVTPELYGDVEMRSSSTVSEDEGTARGWINVPGMGYNGSAAAAASLAAGPPQISSQVHAAVGVYMIAVTLLGSVGNGAVIITFTSSRSMWSAGNILLVNLAVGDFLMSACGAPLMAVSSFRGYWAFSSQVCSFYACLMGTCGLMSIATLSVVAMDRLLVIASFNNSRYITRWCAVKVIFALWIYASIWTIPPLFGWNQYVVEPYGTACSFDLLSRDRGSRSFMLYIFIGGYVCPCTLIVGSYTSLWKIVRSHEQNFTLQAQRMNTDVRCLRPVAKYNVELRIAKVCAFTVFLFCLAWTPYAVVALVGVFGPPGGVTPSAVIWAALAAKGACVYNPIIYSLSHPRFKKRIAAMLCFRNTSQSRTSTWTDWLAKPSWVLSTRKKTSKRGSGCSANEKYGKLDRGINQMDCSVRRHRSQPSEKKSVSFVSVEERSLSCGHILPAEKSSSTSIHIASKNSDGEQHRLEGTVGVSMSVTKTLPCESTF